MVSAVKRPAKIKSRFEPFVDKSIYLINLPGNIGVTNFSLSPLPGFSLYEFRLSGISASKQLIASAAKADKLKFVTPLRNTNVAPYGSKNSFKSQGLHFDGDCYKLQQRIF